MALGGVVGALGPRVVCPLRLLDFQIMAFEYDFNGYYFILGFTFFYSVDQLANNALSFDDLSYRLLLFIDQLNKRVTNSLGNYEDQNWIIQKKWF